MTQMPAVFTVVAAVLNSRANEGTDGLYRPAGSFHETVSTLTRLTKPTPLIYQTVSFKLRLCVSCLQI